ncbi:MipA/OmpV family protein [Maricaulis sp. D1M11]|uniref:MipA/OmpV family protein n=1 Tax=Maricaulis sp. D1M11 TaxID=3076117 RepID=UPI0039B3A436
MVLRLAVAALSTVCLAGAAQAQRGEDPGLMIAAGAAYTPDYLGSDDFRVIPFGAVRGRIAGMRIETDGPGLTLTINPDSAIQYGPYVRYLQGRDAGDIDDTVVRLMPDVDAGVVGGGFVRAQVANEVFLPRDRVFLSGRVGTDITGTFDGITWEASATYGFGVSESLIFALSASVSGSPDDYADQLMSISAEESALTGLDTFAADGGIRDVGLTALANYRFSDDWSLWLISNYSKLQGDFADSPLVSVRGSDDQFFAGIAIGRQF